MIMMEDENRISWEISYLELPGIRTSGGENSIERRKARIGKRGAYRSHRKEFTGTGESAGGHCGNEVQADPDCRCSKDAEGFFERGYMPAGEKDHRPDGAAGGIRFTCTADGYRYREKGNGIFCLRCDSGARDP